MVRAGKAQVSHIMDSIQLLSSSRTPLMGCVLNGVKESGGGYGYGYGYGPQPPYQQDAAPEEPPR